jgi:hypothetical protein
MQIVPARIGSLTRFGQPGTEVAPIDLDTETERWEERANWLLPSASWSELLRPDRAAQLAPAANFHVMMALSPAAGHPHLSWDWLGMAEVIRSRVFS